MRRCPDLNGEYRPLTVGEFLRTTAWTGFCYAAILIAPIIDPIIDRLQRIIDQYEMSDEERSRIGRLI